MATKYFVFKLIVDSQINAKYFSKYFSEKSEAFDEFEELIDQFPELKKRELPEFNEWENCDESVTLIAALGEIVSLYAIPCNIKLRAGYDIA